MTQNAEDENRPPKSQDVNMRYDLIKPTNLDSFSIEDTELYCVCGHLINLHSNGLGGGISICECEDYDCGCIYAELDRDLTVMMEYFQGTDERWFIAKLTTDVKRQWTLTNGGGFPMIKEPIQLEVHEVR